MKNNSKYPAAVVPEGSCCSLYWRDCKCYQCIHLEKSEYYGQYYCNFHEEWHYKADDACEGGFEG